MNKPDGGPEPQCRRVADRRRTKCGLPVYSLRDWFAGMAMQGKLIDEFSTEPKEEFRIRVAREAYIQADTMLKEGEK